MATKLRRGWELTILSSSLCVCLKVSIIKCFYDAVTHSFYSYRREKGIYIHMQTCCTCMFTAALLVINCCIIKYLDFVPGSWKITSKSLDLPWAIGVLVARGGAWPHLSLCKWDDSGWGLVMQETPTFRCQPDLKGWGGGRVAAD